MEHMEHCSGAKKPFRNSGWDCLTLSVKVSLGAERLTDGRGDANGWVIPASKAYFEVE